MFPSRALASLLATLSLLAVSTAFGAIGIEPIANQDIPSGKTLVVPIVATDPGGPARSYTVTIGAPTTDGTATKSAGITGTIRTGDPHFILGVHYFVPLASSTTGLQVAETGTMEFQLLREFTPIATETIGGLTQGGFYSPTVVSGTAKYITFHRVVPGFVIQGGDPTATGTGGPGFAFPNEYSSALIFSGSAGQLAMANSDVNTNDNDGAAVLRNGNSNGSQFFVTLSSDRADLDYGYTLFGQLLRGYGTLNGIATTDLELSGTDSGATDSKPVKPVDILSANITTNNTDAVLLLSGTGVCDAKITIAASSGASSAVQSFTAHAVADSMSDPPIPSLLPNFATVSGSLSVPVPATDLQFDLIRYGYQTFLPVDDGGIISGTSPILTIPVLSSTNTIGVLIPNAGNTIGAEVDSWNGSPRGFASVPFHVSVGQKTLTGTLTPIPAGTFGRLNLLAFPLALFTSGNSSASAAGFTAAVNWGDDTLLSGSQVAIVRDGTQFKLIANHDYTHVGEFPVSVSISDTGGALLTLTGTANIAPSAIAISGSDIFHAGGALTNAVVATFDDHGTASTASDYSATINWGDGAVSAGAIQSAGGSAFRILGTHAYRTPATYTISTSVTRTGESGYSASIWLAAHITGGNVPQILPPFPQAHLAQIWSTLYSDSNAVFTASSTSGGNPYAALIRGTNGYLYGTTEDGGASNEGTVYQITSSGSLGILYSFTGGADGANPRSALVIAGTDGDLFGTTEFGGASGDGTIYKITRSGSFTSLYSFTGGSDGAQPDAPLVIEAGTSGVLYGTAFSGGSSGVGTIFDITTSGSFAVAHSFSGSEGGSPYAPLIAGTDGYFYGTTTAGGTASVGTVFQFIPSTATLTTLHSFTSGTTEGSVPYAALVQGTNGAFFGTASVGGASADGTVFSIAASGTLAITTSSTYSTLYSFTATDDGANPRAALVRGDDGNFYGTTVGGGNNGYGSIFKITPAGSLTPLYSFTGGGDGRNPYSPLLKLPNGYFFGTTEAAGPNGYGTVYRIEPDGDFATLKGFDSGTSFQVAIRGSVMIVNSGNKPSAPGSFAAYVDQNGTIDGNQTAFSVNGQSSFALPALNPGAYRVFNFSQEGSVIDTRLKLPVGFLPTDQLMIGVVNYNDPVANFDGSEKIISPFQF
jgi:uncharacterized repeat protein (TIGR03803 family)